MRCSRRTLLGSLLAVGASPLLAARGPPNPFDLRLQRANRGRLEPADFSPATGMALLYFGASWCGPCRAFQPRLREAHDRFRDAARPIEIVYLSDDAGEAAHRDYVMRERMPWLLIAREDPARPGLRSLGGAALPGLLLMNRQGTILRSSWRPDGSSLPSRLLRDIQELYRA